MTRLKPQPVQILICLAILLPSLSVSIAAILAHSDQKRIRASFDLIMRTSEVQDTLHLLLADIVEVENGQRGYLLTEHRSHLGSFEVARDRVSADLKTLREQTAGSLLQRERWEKINALVSEKLDTASQSLELEQVGQHQAALRLVRDDQKKKTVDAVRNLVELMSIAEKMALSSWTTSLAEQTQQHTRILFSLLVLNTISIACILYLLLHLTRLRSLVRMCAWSRTIEYEGEWVSFEQYLERRFQVDITHGISPPEAAKLAAELHRDPQPKN